MKRLEFTCDGCDSVEYVTMSDDKSNLLPDGWVMHHMIVHENGATSYENSADLCAACRNKMRHAIDPANWPKMDPTVRRFAKKSAG